MFRGWLYTYRTSHFRDISHVFAKHTTKYEYTFHISFKFCVLKKINYEILLPFCENTTSGAKWSKMQNTKKCRKSAAKYLAIYFLFFTFCEHFMLFCKKWIAGWTEQQAVACIVQEYLERNNIKVLPHLPYSLDLALCNFCKFTLLKKDLYGHHFVSDDEVVITLHTFLNSLNRADFQKKNLVKWAECMKQCSDFEDNISKTPRSQQTKVILL